MPNLEGNNKTDDDDVDVGGGDYDSSDDYDDGRKCKFYVFK